LNRTGRTGQEEQDRQDRKNKTGLVERDSQNRTGRTGQQNSCLFFSWVYSIWGPDSEVKMVSIFFFVFAKLCEFFYESQLKATAWIKFLLRFQK
jgi:hypothetical protein